MNDPFGIEKSVERRRRNIEGGAMTGAGAAVATTGLVAGGVPGVKSDAGSLKHPAGIRDSKGARAKAKTTAQVVGGAAKAGGGGVLGFRTYFHRGGLYGFATDAQSQRKQAPKTGKDAFFRGHNRGKVQPERKIIQGMNAGRKAGNAALVGGTALAAAGVAHRKRGEVAKSSKSDRVELASATTAGAGLTGGALLAGTGGFMNRMDRKFSASAADKVKRASKYAPGSGGVQRGTPGRGLQTNAKMYPKMRDSQLGNSLKGATNFKSADRAGRLRGAALQERHFAEVFNSTGKVLRRVSKPVTAAGVAGAGGVIAADATRKKSALAKASTPLTNEQIARKKKVQAGISQGTGALGLAALGGTLAASKGGARVIQSGFRAAGKQAPRALRPERIKDKTTPILATSAGIGALGSFNFASYTKGEADKQIKRAGGTVKKSYDGVSAFGVDHGEFSKADSLAPSAQKKPKKMSAGRAVTGTLLAPVHGAVAGDGTKNKAKAAGSQFAAAALGGAFGSAIDGRAGRLAGAMGGAYAATQLAHNKGWLKPEKK